MASACTTVNDSYSICSNLEASGVGIGAMLSGLLSQGLIGFIIVVGIVGVIIAVVSAVGVGIAKAMSTAFGHVHKK